MVRKKWFIAVLFLLASFAFSDPVVAVSPLLKTQRPTMAPEFSLSDLQGRRLSLSDFKGRPVILFFWATWCPHCRDEILELISEYPKMKLKKIALLTIDMGEPKHKVENFLKGKNIEFPVLLDEDLSVSPNYNVFGIPTFVLIDSDGLIQFNGNIFPPDYSKILKSE